MYTTLADFVVAIHRHRIGSSTQVKNFWFRLIHFAMIALVVVQALFGIECPLTILERISKLIFAS